MKQVRTGLIAIAVCYALVLQGCSATAMAAATKANQILTAVFAIAQADLPSLEATGIIPPVDAIAINAFVALGVQLNATTGQCIAAAGAAPNNKSAFLACYLQFSAGLKNSPELAALRLLSPAAQHQVQLWLAAVDTAVIGVIVALGGTPPAQASASSIKSSPEYKAFESRVKAYVKANYR